MNEAKGIAIAVIDGLGGGLGVQIVERLRAELGTAPEIIALGTNGVATDRMVRAGASRGATGENAFRVVLRGADVLIAPIGVVIADSMMGEITEAMAFHVLNCPAPKFLVPVSQSHFTIVGLEPKPLARLVADAVSALEDWMEASKSSASP